MRILAPIILVICLVGAVTVGTSVHREPAELSFINRGSINILDPAQMSYMQDIRLAQAIWEGLTGLHPETTTAVPAAAYAPEVSEDKMRYVFTIRPEARWSNGDPVTAHDFVRGWRRAMEPGTADVYAELITSHLEGAHAYVEWRTAVVESLSLLRRAEDGATLSAEEIRILLNGPLGARIRERTGLTESGENARNIDWGGLADDLLAEHWAEMQEAFGKVGVRALDDHRLEVRLARPTAYLLDLTAFATYLPVHESIEILRERHGDVPLTAEGLWAYDPQWTKPNYHHKGYPGLIGNGPYILKTWQFKQRIRLEANPYYWNAAAVRSRSIEIVDIEYGNTAFMVYNQGYVDMMTDVSMDYTPNLVQAKLEGRRDDIHPIPCFGTYEYTFNCRPKLPDGQPNPLHDPRVRRALVMAVDKRDLIDNAFPRLSNPVATTFVPPGSIPGYRSPAGLPYDPERARAELAAAGYPGGKGFPVLPLLYNTGFQHEVGAQAIKRMWARELGITVELVGKETKTFAEDKIAGRFAIARGGWFGDYNDPTTFLDLYQTGNGHNVGGWSDARYDALLAQAAAELDTQKRLDLLSEAERILVEDGVPLMPLYQYVIVYAWRPHVKGIHPNPRLQFPLHYIAVEQPRKRSY